MVEVKKKILVFEGEKFQLIQLEVVAAVTMTIFALERACVNMSIGSTTEEFIHR
jgi:hypothetical protein